MYTFARKVSSIIVFNIVPVKNSKKYIPQRRFNPAVQERKLSEMSRRINDRNNVLSSVIGTYEKHIEYLSNFAGHNMGNAIQSMYATLVMHDDNPELTRELKGSLDNLNAILDSFKQIISCTHSNEFSLKDLMLSLESMTRSSCALHKVTTQYVYDKNDSRRVRLPFQSLLQVMHNLISNSIKALKDTSEKKLVVESELTDSNCLFKIKDNGCGISDDVLPHIFEYKFTTTENGSGIGLFHAHYIIEERLHGTIDVERNSRTFSTIFKINIPIQ